MLPTEYRPCVVAVFTNSAGQVLVGERSDCPGAWQFPQGGIDPGESALNALYREMREEIGCDSFRIKREAAGLIKYRFPSEMTSKIAKKWLGQSQIWFLVEFDQGAVPNLSIAEGEFANLAWRSVSDVIDGIILWKKETYIEGLTKLGVYCV